MRGEKFKVIANLNDKRGWVVKIAAVCSGNDGVGDLDDVVDTDSEYEDNGDDDNSIGEDNDDGDDGNSEGDFIIDDDGKGVEEQVKAKAPKLRSPLSSSWIVPIIKTVITAKPNTSNKDLRHLLQFHCWRYALTRAVLQKARDMTKLQVFGSKEENAKYFIALRDELESRNHRVELMMANYDEAIQRMLLVVVADEMKRRT